MEILSLEKIIKNLYEDEDYFYRKVGYMLSKYEQEYLKTLIVDKSCLNCNKKTCNSNLHVCNDWHNPVMIGKAKIKQFKL